MNKPKKTENNTTTSPVVNAFLIGFLIGIIIFSVAVNSWGFLTLLPLFLIHKLMQKPQTPNNDDDIN